MDFDALLSHLTPRTRAERGAFEATLAANPAFECFRSYEALRDAIAAGSSVEVSERARLLSAIVSAHRATGAGAWTALAAHAVRPLLAQFARRLRTQEVVDAQQAVLAGLLETLRILKTDPTETIFPRLRYHLSGRVFGYAKAAAVWSEFLDLDAADKIPAAPLQSRTLAGESLRAVFPEGPEGDEMTAIVLETVAGDTSLVDYVRRRHPSLRGEQLNHAYGAARRLRDRALDRLRTHLCGRQRPRTSA